MKVVLISLFMILLQGLVTHSFAQKRTSDMPEKIVALKVSDNTIKGLNKIKTDAYRIDGEGVLRVQKEHIIRYFKKRNVFIITHRNNEQYEVMDVEEEISPGVWLSCSGCERCRIIPELDNPNIIQCAGLCSSGDYEESIYVAPDKDMEFQTPQGDWRPALR